MCVTPTTERDLADGIGPARRLYDAGCRISIGSDSHAVVDPFEELRGLEMDERLATQERGHWTAAELLDIGTGRRGAIAVGAAGRPGHDRHRQPAHRRHRRRRAHGGRSPPRPPTSSRWCATVGSCSPRATRPRSAASSTRPSRSSGDEQPRWSPTSASSSPTTPSATGLLGLVADAALVVEGGKVAWVGPATEAPAADARVDAAGRAVLPGFVDSHSHLVFAGDRAPEFAARMAGTPYAAGGIRTTVAATRAGDRRAAHRARRPARRRDAPPGHDDRRDQERLRADRPRRGAQPGRGAAVHRRDDVPRRARRARRVRRGPGRLRRPGHRADARGRRPARPLGRRLLRDRRVRRRPGPRRTRGRRGEGAEGPAARQPARPRPGRPARRRAGPRRGRPLHLPRRRGRRRAPRLGHDRHPAARRRVLDPPALPGRPAPPRRRRPGRPGQRLQPRLQLHELGPALHRAGGPRDGHDARRGRPRRDVRRSPGARPGRRRRPGRREACRLRDAGRPEPRPSGLSARCPAGRRAPGSAGGRSRLSKAPERYLRQN